MDSLIESGMEFGPFQDDDFFYIEESKMRNKTPGIRTVEFIFHPKKSLLYFVEAKSSAPVNPDEFAKEIAEKFIDSFELLMAGLNDRKTGRDEIGEKIQKLDYKKVSFKFFLIINGHKEEWLPKIKVFIDENMKRFHVVWNSEVIVMNEVIAREYHLIK